MSKESFNIHSFVTDDISDIINEDAEFIPLTSSEDEEEMDNENLPEFLPVLPLRNTVLFPGVVIPITIGRDKSIRLIKEEMKGKKTLAVVAQKDQEIEDPATSDLYTVGMVADILRVIKMPDASMTVVIRGRKRCKIDKFVQEHPYFKAAVSEYNEIKPEKGDERFGAIVDSLRDLSIQIIQSSPNIPSEAAFPIKNIDSPTFLINFISSNLNTDIVAKQQLLEEKNVMERATQLLKILNKELQLLQIKNDIHSKVRDDIDKQQREYFLNQQIKTIQEELGDSNHYKEIEHLKERAKTKKWNDKIAKAFNKEVEKLSRTNPNMAEFGIQLNYLELLLDLPWNEYTKDVFDLKRGTKILDRDHYGMEKVKERILEYLAVLKLKGDMKAPILCLYGPPGVGKTSLGKSIAESIGRKYIRMSLGGLRDEAEIRGHRKTYIGAMPGRIIQNLKKVKSANPVFILDEIDKLSHDSHGDPSSALLEVLDPEQNNAFYDNYVEQEFDLSKVMFIATANSLATIQPALRDRMEIIELTGYSVEEKVQIAKKHLIPKQLKENGVSKEQISISAALIQEIIEGYTFESGVRKLEQRMAKVIRYRAKQIALEEEFELAIKSEDLNKIFGPARTKEKATDNQVAGVVTGLAWTPAGGDMLFVESLITKGKGKLSLTGNLGDVMKESATIALEYLKAHSGLIGLNPETFENWNVHIHVPEGATPKDGPSAGITMLTAIASAFSQFKVKKGLAMSGEITLRGKVLPVGGIKEKVLAAKRGDVKEIILCKENEKDVNEIDPKYIKGIKFHYVERMSEVLDIALTSQKVKNPLAVA
jgi:ATP-dependent Lon protease